MTKIKVYYFFRFFLTKLFHLVETMSGATTTATAKISSIKVEDSKDDTKDGKKKKTPSKPIDRQMVHQIFIIGLTLFYGQLLANVFYNNFITGIPELVVDSTSALAILKVVIGILILATAIFSLITVYMKKHTLIFISSCVLMGVCLVALVITVTDLILRRERGQTVGKDFASAIGQVVLESVFRIAAISVQFVFIHLLKQEYQPVPTSA